MNEKQREELKTLAEGLPRVPEEKFRMHVWGEGTLVPDEPGFTCDYAGCAIGWLPKLLPGCGLTLEQWGGSLQPTFNGESGFQAVAEYFGIGYQDADFLFSPSHYPGSDETTPLEVSERIHAFLADPDLRLKHAMRYTVRVTEIRRFSNLLEVEATDEEEAEEKARDLFACDCSDSDCEEFYAEVVGRECIG